MQLANSLDNLVLPADTVLTIGTFDGVHRGHRYLLEQLVQHARETGRLSAVLSFYPHPRLVLRPEARPACLSTPSERAAALEALAVDLLVVLPFTLALASTPAEDFIGELVRAVRMRELWVGAGFALGRSREGDITHLTQLGARLGYTLHVVEPLYDGGEPVSSTRIRGLVHHGDVAEAGRLLGRPYAISGPVVAGRQRGRALGFRTANLRLNPECATPANGVYAVRVQTSYPTLASGTTANSRRYDGVANLGVRPSFGESDRLLEVHLLDYAGDLYGENVTVEFVQRLRPELVFEDTEALVAQIRRDVEQARAVLAGA
jgi:riboflavin kinase / FMN adenylyltransferase